MMTFFSNFSSSISDPSYAQYTSWVSWKWPVVYKNTNLLISRLLRHESLQPTPRSFQGTYLEARGVKVRRHKTIFVRADDSNCFSTSQILLSDHDVFGIAAVVVEATFGSAAGPGAIKAVELWKTGLSGLIRTSGRIWRVVVVRVSTMRTHF